MGPRTAVTAVFFLNGASFSSWYSRLPAIQDRLDLGPGAVGLALLGAPLGLLIAQPAVGAIMRCAWLAAARGSGATVAGHGAAARAGGQHSHPVRGGHARRGSQRRAGHRHERSGLGCREGSGPGACSVLCMRPSPSVRLAGAGLAGAVAGLGIGPLPHPAGAAVLGAIAAAAIVVPGLLHDRPDGAQPRNRLARPSRRLALYGAIAFCVLLAEGAVFDWSAIFLASEQRADPGLAPMGLAAFSLTMGIGRLLADSAAAASVTRRSPVGAR